MEWYEGKENVGLLFRSWIMAVQDDTFSRIIMAIIKMLYYMDTFGGY